ncbi:hypothetical protein NCS52_00166300 [Fusarium sp. LHS14.1]|nr:hypothetical protein NCS52_00166300 [Fusarium sp. LHS14.1]
MGDTDRLLRDTPGANDVDIELQQRSQTPSQRSTLRTQRSKKSYKVCYVISGFYALAVAFFLGHLFFFQYLDGELADDPIPQSIQAALGNVFAVFVDICLLGGLGVAYNQILWSLLRKKPFQAQIIDKLIHLPGNPWDLFHRKILHRPYRLWTVWITTFLCATIPFWLIFPPGCVETKFLNKNETTFHDVKTMNISDYGNGTIRQFVEHSLFEVNGDLNYNPAWARPRLKAMAGQVLASGEPVELDSPCGSSCVYNITLEGPSFHCEEPKQSPTKCGSIYEAEDLVKSGVDGERYALWNNAFQITWDPKPNATGCDLKSRRSLVCRMKLSTYTLQIKNSLDASRSIRTTVDNHRDVWTDQAWIQAQFYYYFYNVTHSTLWPEPIRLDELHTNFTNSQAFAIRQAAVGALQGQVRLSIDGGALSFQGNASLVLGSPYIGLHDKYDPQFNISAGNIERFLQDVVISTLSLGTSTHNGDIKALVGAEVYVFSEKFQFFLPYGVCLGMGFLINLYGFWCWRRNGSAAGNSFLQFATTTGSSKTLNKLVAPCTEGDEHLPKELKELELRFVDGKFHTRGEGANHQ